MMEQRHSKRITAGYRTEIIFRDKIHTGVIENLSASGAYVLTDPLDPAVEFVPDENAELKFETPAGETVTLECTIVWSSKIPPHNARNRIGLEIKDLPWRTVGIFL